jgi:hypothetical protein
VVQTGRNPAQFEIGLRSDTANACVRFGAGVNGHAKSMVNSNDFHTYLCGISNRFRVQAVFFAVLLTFAVLSSSLHKPLQNLVSRSPALGTNPSGVRV